MSQENVSTVWGMYAAFERGDIATVIAALDPQVEWWEAENFIYADKNPYIGPQGVLEGVFMRIGNEWDGFSVSPKEVLDAGDTVSFFLNAEEDVTDPWPDGRDKITLERYAACGNELREIIGTNIERLKEALFV